MAGVQGRAAVIENAPLLAGLQHAMPELARTFRDPWWIIGSAAMALIGVPDAVPQDIDVLCSTEDALRLRAAWATRVDQAYRPRHDGLFRSTFARFHLSPMPLEVMGGLEVMTPQGWHPLRVLAETVLDVAGRAVRVPTLADQRRIFMLFGRPKDLAKAARIAAILEGRRAA